MYILYFDSAHCTSYNLDNLDKIKLELSMEWRLADAKNRFSELVNLALSDGPQIIKRRGDTVIVISAHEYDKLIGKHVCFKDFLLGEGPSLEGLDLARDKTSMRDTDL